METFEQTRTLKDGYFVASEDGPTTYFGERTEDSIVFLQNSGTHVFQMWQLGQAATLAERC